MKKIFSLSLVVLIVASLLTGCGSSSVNQMADSLMPMERAGFGNNKTMSNSAVVEDYKYSDATVNTNSTSSSGSSNESSTNMDTDVMKASSNKIIYSGSLRIQTSSLVETDELVKNKIEEVGGYISNYDRDADTHISIVARVPANKFETILNDEQIAENNTVYKSMSAEDVTLQYSDTEAELESLRIQEERLLGYLQAAANVEEMMTIENSLQDVRNEIKIFENRIRYLDNYISYSELRVEISARYIAPEEDASFLETLKYTVLESFENFKDLCMWFITTIILLFPYIVIFVILYIFIKTSIKRKREKRKKEKEAKTKTE